MPDTAERIAAEGVAVTFADGSQHRVRFTMRALALLENHYGSLDRVDTALDGKVFNELTFLLSAGLKHEGLTEDDILDNADPARLGEYADAIGSAFRQALGDNGEAEGGTANPPSPASPSTGDSSTTSPPSVTDAAMSSSGG